MAMWEHQNIPKHDVGSLQNRPSAPEGELKPPTASEDQCNTRTSSLGTHHALSKRELIVFKLYEKKCKEVLIHSSTKFISLSKLTK